MPDRTGGESTPTGDQPVRILAFAGVRDIVGAHEIELALAGRCTAAELWPILIERFPGLAPYRAAVRVAVNGAYATDRDPVGPGDEVALIPPVAGG